MDNVIEMKKSEPQPYRQQVTIDGKEGFYSLHNFAQEVEQHTHIKGKEKGVLRSLQSCSQFHVMDEILQIRGVTPDTLFQWVIEKMKSIVDGYGSEPWREVKKNSTHDFFFELVELSQLKNLFQNAIIHQSDEPLTDDDIPLTTDVISF